MTLAGAIEVIERTCYDSRMAGAGMIEIDGAYLEGGGQILRTACALSAVTGRACRIYDIRRGRPKPGLRAQHLAGLEALSGLCSGSLEGARLGSTEISFHPGRGRVPELSVNIPTAGSITLVLQALLIPAMLGPRAVRVDFSGGATDTYFSPTLDYFSTVLLGVLGRAGVRADIDVSKRGCYPGGGARVRVRIHPARPGRIDLTEKVGDGVIKIISRASGPLARREVAERQARGAADALGPLGMHVETEIHYHDTISTGSGILLAAMYSNTVLGADRLGKRGKRAEEVGREAAEALLKEVESGAPLDRHMADQVLPFMAFGGESSVMVSEVTGHARTNMWVIEKFFDGKFTVKDRVITWAAE
jgi:RNA 3'-phosphate cyclase